MLINASNMYRPGDSKSFYEYKENHAGEATIIGYKEGENKYYGILGKYHCKIPENGKKHLFYKYSKLFLHQFRNLFSPNTHAISFDKNHF